MILRTCRKLFGSAVVAATLRGQRDVPYLPRERIEELRDRRLRATVRHAARSVPYYRDLFKRKGIDPRRIRTAADLDQLPLLDRDLVRARPDLFVAAGREAVSFLTSGTTGVPLAVHHDPRSLLANIAYGERERDPVIKACGGSFRPKELYVGYETSTFKKVIAFYERSVLLPVKPRRRFVSLMEPIESVVAAAIDERPDVLVGYGGWLDLFFRTVSARGLKVPPPKIVMAMGEALPPGSRALIEGRFGVPVMSRYNAVESFKIGFTCERRTGFHIHEDLCHVRVVGSDDRSLPPGASGRVVISNLVNRATVLLNYPIGDVAALSSAECPCGRTFRLLSDLEGRVEDVLTLADGSAVHPRAVWQVIKDDRDVLQYQLTQHELRRFELRLATVDEDGFRNAVAGTLPGLKRLLGAECVIETVRAESCREPGTKFRAVVSFCAQVKQNPFLGNSDDEARAAA